jgi:hypothetical protein
MIGDFFQALVLGMSPADAQHLWFGAYFKFDSAQKSGVNIRQDFGVCPLHRQPLSSPSNWNMRLIVVRGSARLCKQGGDSQIRIPSRQCAHRAKK